MSAVALQRASAAAGRFVRRRPLAIVLVTLALTVGFGAALAVIPSHPSSDSFDADNDVVRALDRIESDLPPRGFVIPFLVEGRDGNVLTRAAFDEILAREGAIRADPVASRYVYRDQDPNLRMEVSSVWSLPDTLRAVMNGDTPLTYAIGWHADVGGPGTTYEDATDAEWYDALDRLLSFTAEDGSAPFQRALSQDATETGGAWSARSMMATAAFDYAVVFADYERDPARATDAKPYFEDFQLHVWDVAREGERHTAWNGVALGINTEIEREVAESSRLVGLAILVIGVALYVTLRNWRDWAVAFASLPLLIVWMLGGARILGLSNNQFTAMLPILILALGVDYAIHGVRRYREERAAHAPGDAVEQSISFLGPALIMACATTAAAFFSNGFSSIAGLRDWGIEGGLAIFAALWLTGMFAPALRYLWDARRVLGGKLEDAGRRSVAAARVREGTRLGRVAVWTSAHPVIVLALVAAVTVPATVSALRIESDFDAKDFFDNDADLIVILDRVAEDFPDEGEPAVLLVEADVADPRVLAALDDGIRNVRDAGYSPERDYSLPAIVKTFTAHPQENGASYADADADGIPDSRVDVVDLLTRALSDGVYASATRPAGPPVPGTPVPPLPPPAGGDVTERVLAYSKETVRELVHPTADGGFDLTLVVIGIPNTDDFATLPVAAADIRAALADLHALQGDAVEKVTLTGEPYKRVEQVNAVTASLKFSVTFSVLVCLVILVAAFRNVAYAVVTLVPVILLIAWLYGFMQTVGLSLNLVTATIAAMSIGVGVDYSLHIAERFREEAERRGRSPSEAVRRAMDSSGVALFGSATTTVVGFLVLLAAPMPLFRTFGFLTAAMAAASFLAAAVVLPPLLVMLEKRRLRRAGESRVLVPEAVGAEPGVVARRIE